MKRYIHTGLNIIVVGIIIICAIVLSGIHYFKTTTNPPGYLVILILLSPMLGIIILIIGLSMLGRSSKRTESQIDPLLCPKCSKPGKVEDGEVINKEPGYKTVTRTDRIKVGETTGTIERHEQIHVTHITIRWKFHCKYCQYKWEISSDYDEE